MSTNRDAAPSGVGTVVTSVPTQDVTIGVSFNPGLEEFAENFNMRFMLSNPSKYDKIDLTVDDLKFYFYSFLRVTIDFIHHDCKFKVADIQTLNIPCYLESAVAALDIVYDDITGKTLIPVLLDDGLTITGYDVEKFYSASNWKQLSDISRKLSFFKRDGILLTENAFGNGGKDHDATLRQMRIIVKNGIVMSRNMIQPASSDESYYAAFLNQQFVKAEVLEGFDESYKINESYFDVAYDFAETAIRKICKEERLVWSK